MNLADRLKGVKVNQLGKRKEPLWKGPSDEGDEGGITFSMLSRFLACRERFRLLVVEGLKPADRFNHRLEFGNMWHVCEEILAKTNAAPLPGPKQDLWRDGLTSYAQSLMKKYPTDQNDIANWYGICETMFPLYVRYWSQHPDVKDRTPLLQEQVFHVPYKLPSGRIVRLKGKWDSVDLIGNGKDAGIYIQENKTKSDINEVQLKNQLASGFDCQTMMYIVAYEEYRIQPKQYRLGGEGVPRGEAMKGVRYNVVRRPRQYQGKKETHKDFLNRLQRIIEEDQAHFFMRWKVDILPADVNRFRRECLDPILEQLCDWWEWIGQEGDDRNLYAFGKHWRHPFNVYNPLLEGGSSELDNYLLDGSQVGLTQATTLFPELEGG